MDFTKLQLDEYLNQVAERSPAPGGGSVAAVAGALGCSLARMVAEYCNSPRIADSPKAAWSAAQAQLHRTDELMRALVTKDALAYASLQSAAKRAKTDASAHADHSKARMEALAVPMELAALATHALDLLDGLKSSVSKLLLADWAAAAALLEAATTAAGFMVHVNAADVDDARIRSKVLVDAESMITRCRRHRESIEKLFASTGN